MQRITSRIPEVPAAVTTFVDRLLDDDAFFELAATDLPTAFKVAGVSRSQRMLTTVEWRKVLTIVAGLRFADGLRQGELRSDVAYLFDRQTDTLTQKNTELKQEGLGLADARSRRDVFTAAFGLATGGSPIAGEDQGTHTGYNEGWSDSSSKTATTESGTHRIFPKEFNLPMANPAEALAVAQKAGLLK
ncbi:MAG: hypothetical protein BGO38_03225 [Cellulomonas sp. 73-145]|uniref:hypothetical protein n=1 Tax=Cellulomonas sp. 73-145 TaxID=1895739 RepID=UPI00092BF73F|nr:hypothetical protein [Cellulomonas sp. 73-145]MBN9325928.1 hypothetical protein [Cellulomonas sp.]OJV56962.1 MAG: hypothetical protein BGO38_03225 [Cellulomonas sp. 73-145]